MAHVDILIRWIHIAAAAFVVGGFVYARFVVLPAMDGLSSEERSAMVGRLAARLKNLALTAIVLLLVSGSYNFFKVVQGAIPSKSKSLAGSSARPRTKSNGRSVSLKPWERTVRELPCSMAKCKTTPPSSSARS